VNMQRLKPDFDNPPVVEVALAIEFIPLKGLDIPKAVLFWQQSLPEYAIFQVQPPIINPNTALIGMAGQLPQRCWFMDQSGARLVQIQHDRLIYNWRKTDAAEAYPHYGPVRDAFLHIWRRFGRFLEEQKLEGPKVQQCEVTYIDHLDLQPVAKLGDVSPLFAGSMEKFLPGTALVNFSTAFLLPDNEGQLTIGLQSARRNADDKALYQMTSTVRLPLASPGLSDVQKALDSGHQWSVDAFTGFISTKLQDSWGRGE
jgi:uncharacterized protein (TIGR04255 family)